MRIRRDRDAQLSANRRQSLIDRKARADRGLDVRGRFPSEIAIVVKVDAAPLVSVHVVRLVDERTRIRHLYGIHIQRDISCEIERMTVHIEFSGDFLFRKEQVRVHSIRGSDTRITIKLHIRGIEKPDFQIKRSAFSGRPPAGKMKFLLRRHGEPVGGGLERRAVSNGNLTLGRASEHPVVGEDHLAAGDREISTECRILRLRHSPRPRTLLAEFPVTADCRSEGDVRIIRERKRAVHHIQFPRPIRWPP